MVCINRIFGCCLAGLLGLVSFNASAQFAPTYADEGMAREACSAYFNGVKDSYTGGFLVRTESLNTPRCSLGGSANGLNSFSSKVWVCDPYQPNGVNCTTSTAYTGSSSQAIQYGATFYGSNGVAQFAFSTSGYCSTRPERFDMKAPTANGSGYVCDIGCTMQVALQASGPLYSAVPTGSTCISASQGGEYPDPVTVDPNDNDGDGTPNDTDPCPNDTTNTCSAGDNDGDGTPNSSDPCPEDSTNSCPAADGDGDGIPNGEDSCPEDALNECQGTGNPTSPPGDGSGTAGGGFNCSSPPVCSGDAIQCAMLYQQWSTRCEVARAEAAADARGDEVLTGLEGIKTSVDGLGEKIDGVGTAVTGLGEKIDGVGTSVEGFRSDMGGVFSDGGVGNGAGLSDFSSLTSTVSIDPNNLDDSGLGFPRSCPLWQDVSFSIGVTAIVIPLSSMTLHCEIFEWTGLLMLAFSAYLASRILLRSE